MYNLNTIFNDTLVQAIPVDTADTQMITILGILLVVLFIFSFAISGSQVAFFSFGIKDINLIKTKTQPSYKRVLDLLERPQELLYALQIASYFFYIAIIFTASFLMNHLFTFQFGLWVILLIKAAIIFIFIFLFCECLPRTYAVQENIRFAKDFGMLTEFVYYFFRRIAASMLYSSNKLETALFKSDSGAYYNMELNNAINLTHRNASDEEKRILQSVLKFNKVTVKQVMKSRLDISGLEYGFGFLQVIDSICTAKYSRLPVYDQSLDKIVGLLNIKDIVPYINEKDSFDWHKFITTIYFVHEHKMANELLEEFQQKHLKFAVVVDEFGGTSGIVTLQDVQEEIIGEIKDEHEDVELDFKKIDDYNYIFDGKLMISDVCRIIGIPTDTFDVVKGDSDSLAGLVLELAGEIPALNQIIECGDFKFLVEDISKNRLHQIRVVIDMEE